MKDRLKGELIARLFLLKRSKTKQQKIFILESKFSFFQLAKVF
jgi:hypothetical protein